MLFPPRWRSLETRLLLSRARRRQPWRRRRPLLESLEDRRLLATIVVNNPTDTPVAGQTDLRQAIALAATPAFPGADKITFDSSVFGTPKTITLDPSNGQLTLDSDVTIAGPSVGVTIARSTAAGTPDFRIMGVNSGVTATLENLTLTGGNVGSSSGGAIFNSGTLTLTNSTLSGNSATSFGGDGGGIFNSYGGRTTLTNSTLSGNSAYHGGGIFNSFGGTSTQIHTTLTLTNTTLTGNSASNGGGIYNSDFGTATLTNSTLSGNSASGGGGIDNRGTATLTNSTLSGNSAGYSGGIYNRGTATLTLTNSTLSGNSAGGSGGGIENRGTATLTNSTLSGNSAYNGGGIKNLSQAMLTLTNSTLSGNSAGAGGGIFNNGTATLNNTIVANSPSGGDVDNNSGTLTGSHNLIEDGSGGLADTIVADPKLGPLANNGGPTQTMALLAGSPAINAGSNALAVDPSNNGQPLTTDQRGVPFARIAGGTVDIGAYEVQTLHLVVDTTADENNGNYGPGDLSLREAITLANANPGTDTISFDIPGAGVHTINLLSALPLISDPVTIDGTTQPGYSGVPLISLTPSTADPFTGDGLTLLGGGNTVQGLDIGGFNGNGIRITRGGGNVIQNNRIGTDPAGTTARPNSGSGILIEASSNNTILDNLVSGNGAAGITLTDTAAPLGLSDTLSGTVSGSLPDTDVTGVFPSFSGNYSLQGLLQGAFFNLNIPNAPGQLSTTATISNSVTAVTGSTTLGPWSATLSGQGLTQTLNAPASTAPTTIALSEGGIAETFTLTGTLGDFPYTFLGTFSGTFNFPEVGPTTVTGPVTGLMTVAVQETLPPVTSTPTNNQISGNKIGTDVSGNAALGNVLDGILLSNASGTSISGNQISGNGVDQDAAGINVTGVNSSGNVMSNNLIGTNAAGTADLGNSLHGIFVGNGASNNTIGPGNVISGNGMPTNQGVGVYVFGSTTTGNRITGNRIGTNATGTAGLTDSAGLIHPVIGVLISQSSGNTVQGNLISGNRFVGLEIAGGAGGTASGNLVQDNKIGTNFDGTTAIPNGLDGIFISDAPNNTIGGTAAGAGNLISGNGSVGIQLFGPLTRGNVVQGNALGLNSAGRPTLPNRAGGIFVNTGPLNNQVGGTAPDQANRGQTRQQFTVTGFHQSHHQSHAGSKTRHSPPTGRRFRIRGRARTSLRAHSKAH